MIIVRYADDAIIGFQHEDEARQYLQDLQERLGVYGLELNRDKTRLIRFGRFARQNREERGEGKPESFAAASSTAAANGASPPPSLSAPCIRVVAALIVFLLILWMSQGPA